jgi:6-pyruvoyltetrahydropterin/6-carboxytetrahydropterin synthase
MQMIHRGLTFGGGKLGALIFIAPLLVEAYVKGENLDKSNILVDYKVLKREMKAVLDLLDHKDINELPEFKGESPSSEMISMFIYNKLKEKIVQVSKVSVWETATSCASYYEE